jgi:Na+/phosphate symporter
MVGFELKGLIVILLIISIVINFMTYEEKWTNKKSILFGLNR